MQSRTMYVLVAEWVALQYDSVKEHSRLAGLEVESFAGISRVLIVLMLVQEVEPDAHSTSALSEEGHSVGIPSEVADVILHPLHGHLLIVQTIVAI